VESRVYFQLPENFGFTNCETFSLLTNSDKSDNTQLVNDLFCYRSVTIGVIKTVKYVPSTTSTTLVI